MTEQQIKKRKNKKNHQKRKQEEPEEELREDYQTNGKSPITFVKIFLWLIHLQFFISKKTTENRNLKRKLQVKKKMNIKQTVHPQLQLYETQ